MSDVKVLNHAEPGTAIAPPLTSATPPVKVLHFYSIIEPISYNLHTVRTGTQTDLE